LALVGTSPIVASRPLWKRFLLGHRDANITRAVYVREVADGRRRAMRRSRMNAEYRTVLEPTEPNLPAQASHRDGAIARLVRHELLPILDLRSGLP
jgi:hypothetical protein